MSLEARSEHAAPPTVLEYQNLEDGRVGALNDEICEPQDPPPWHEPFGARLRILRMMLEIGPISDNPSDEELFDLAAQIARVAQEIFSETTFGKFAELCTWGIGDSVQIVEFLAEKFDADGVTFEDGFVLLERSIFLEPYYYIRLEPSESDSSISRGRLGRLVYAVGVMAHEYFHQLMRYQTDVGLSRQEEFIATVMMVNTMMESLSFLNLLNWDQTEISDPIHILSIKEC